MDIDCLPPDLVPFVKEAERAYRAKCRWPGRKTGPGKWRKQNARYRAKRRNAFVEDVDRVILLSRHHGRCGICKEEVDPLDFHVDHVIPLSLGGEHSYANTQPAHPVCNRAKGAHLQVTRCAVSALPSASQS